MSESNLPPEQWRELFHAAGIEFGYRPLAKRIGATHTRVRRVLRGGGTSEDALREVADAFRVPVSKVRELRGEPAVEIEPFTLPDDAGRLNDDERNVIRSMIRALLNARDAAPPDAAADSVTGGGDPVPDAAAPEPSGMDEPQGWGPGLDPDALEAAADRYEHGHERKKLG